MALDKDDKEFIANLIGKALKENNEAQQGEFKKELKGLLDAGAERDKTLKALAEKLADDDKKKKAKGDDDDDKKKKAKEDDDSETAKRMAALEKKLEESELATKKAEDARRRDGIDVSVRKALEAGGVTGRRIEQAMAYVGQLGLVEYGDGDKAKSGWKTKDKLDQDTVIDVEKGVAAWLESEVGKDFLPSSGAGGTGDRTGSGKVPKDDKGKVDWGALGGQLRTTDAIDRVSG